jgi:hypothetical protein
MPTSTNPNGGSDASGNTNNAGTPASNTPAPRKRADQDQQMANRANETRQIVGVIMDDGPVRSKLAPKGFDTQKLTGAILLCEEFDKKWNKRQNAMGIQADKAGVFTGLFDEATKSLSDFREIVRGAENPAPPPALLVACGITGEVPTDLQKFLTHAKSAYTTAKKPEYSAFMTNLGYSEEVLDDQITALDDLRKADEEHSKESGNAQKATDERDKAFEPVNAFRNSVMKIARRVFRKEPEQLSKLDF